jgi:hypothetical protein
MYMHMCVFSAVTYSRPQFRPNWKKLQALYL